MKTPTIHRSAMLKNKPRFWGWFSEPIFKHLSLDERSVEQVQKYDQEGQLIYVMRSRSLLDYLAFNYLFLAANLPLARFCNGLNLTIFRSIREWFVDFVVELVRRSPSLPDSGLNEQLSHGDAALIFLRERGWVAPKRTSPIYFERLVAFQRSVNHPLYLVPQLIHWPPVPPSKQRSLMDILFGNVEEAGRLRKMIHFLRYRKKASVRLGEPVNLQEAIASHEGWSDARIARKLRRLLLIHLNKEALAIHGPPIKQTEQLLYELTERKIFQQELAEYSEHQGISLEKASGQASRYLGEIASQPKHFVHMAFARFLDFLFFKVFDSVEIDEADIHRVKDAAKHSRSAPLILIPSHKSHIDYLVVSWLFLRQDFIPPYIAAGANLNFFPVGSLLRRGGAFFLRRSFVGLDLYKMVFKHYLWKLVREGYPLEFFIEGGRTRTGKLLMPKMGMLSMLLEGIRRGEYKDLQFVPISLSYERVVETSSYRKELTGGEKKSESVRGVLEASQVFRSRYGRIYVHFEAPVRLKDYLAQRGIDQLSQDSQEFKQETERLAFYLMYRIQEATVLSPSALVGAVLLSHERRGLSEQRLQRHIGFILTLAQIRGARLSRSIRGALERGQRMIDRAALISQRALFDARGQSVEPLTQEALTLLRRLVDRVERGGRCIYVVPDKRRIELDYYRNSILALLAPEVIIATVVASHPEGVDRDTFLFETRWLSELFKLEFIYRNDLSFEDIVEESLDHLNQASIISYQNERYVIDLEEEALILCGAIRHLMESYWIAAHTLKASIDEPIEGKAWTKSAVEQAELAYLEGEVFRAEVASSVCLANALKWFVHKGWVKESTEGEGKKRVKYYQLIDTVSFEGFFEQMAKMISRLPDGPTPDLSPIKYHQEFEAERLRLSQPPPTAAPEPIEQEDDLFDEDDQSILLSEPPASIEPEVMQTTTDHIEDIQPTSQESTSILLSDPPSPMNPELTEHEEIKDQSSINASSILDEAPARTSHHSKIDDNMH